MSIQLTGSVEVLGSVSSSLFGTASWSDNSISASYVENAPLSDVSLQTKAVTVDVKAAMALSTGQVAHIFGANGANLLVTTASYLNDNLSANTIGIVTASIADNGFGSLTTFGPLVGLDTSAFNAGDLLYLGDDGNITNVEPVAPLHTVRLGYVTKVSAGNGEIFVKIDNGYEIKELHDVLISEPTSSGQLLVKSGSVWINSYQLTGSYGLTGSLIIGSGSKASEESSIAFGISAIATASFAFAQGFGVIASGTFSHAEGSASVAIGFAAHAEGFRTIASGSGSHAEGFLSNARGLYAHAEGSDGRAFGTASHAEGISARAWGFAAHAEGSNTNASGAFAHSEGNFTAAHGQASHAEGSNTNAWATASHAEGFNTNTFGIYSHAEGFQTTTIGTGSHAEGGFLSAGGTSISGGLAIGNGSHAEGFQTTTIGIGSHAEGSASIAIGSGSHAEGFATTAIGKYSHTIGFGTITIPDNSFAAGKWNIARNLNDAEFIIGNGVDNANRSNIFYAGGTRVEVSGSLNTSASVVMSNLGDYASDAAAATAGVPLTGLYHTAGTVKIRLV